MFINGMGRLYCSRSLRSEAGVRVGCSSTREGSGVSGCLQRRERIADAAKPREKRRRLGGLTVSSIGSGRFLSYLGAGGFFFTSRGGRTANRAKKRHKAGVSHQLPAWPGTTITSSSCSSSVTAVSERRGCGTGSGPCGGFLQGEENKCSSVATVYFYDAFTTYHFSFSSCKMIGEMYTSAIFLWR